MPLPLQAKLLRVLEQREVLRVGALKPRPIDVRFIAATNRDLEVESARGRFRLDLFFRLNGISVVIPPLRHRVEEIEPLARVFLAQACAAARRAEPMRISAQALALLKRYAWPGNVRELRNIIERAVLLSSGDTITLEYLPSEKMGPVIEIRAAARSGQSAPSGKSDTMPPPRPSAPGYERGEYVPLDSVTQQVAFDARARGGTAGAGGAIAGSEDERHRIIQALDRCAGNQTQAAKILGISRRTLVTRLSTYDLPRPRKKPSDVP